jgi:hypothetical protein
MAATMDAIKNSIAQAATFLLPMIESIVNFLANAQNLKKVFVGIAAVFGTIVALSLAAKINTASQISLQSEQLAILLAQNRMALVQQGLTETQIGLKEAEAVASVTAGSGYLGPGAIIAGLAAGAALAAITGIALGGGSSSSTTAPTYTPIEPISSTVASAKTAEATTQSVKSATVSAGRSGPGDVYIDGVKAGFVLNKSNDQQYGNNKQ